MNNLRVVLGKLAGGGRRPPPPETEPLGGVPTNTGESDSRPVAAEPWSAKADTALHEFLHQVPDLDDPEFRRTVLRDLGRRLGPGTAFAVPYSPQTADHLLNLVHACRSWHEPHSALAELAASLRTLRPGTSAVDWLGAAVESVTESGLLSPELQLAVLRTVRALSPPPTSVEVQRLVESMCTDGETHPVRARDSLPEAVSRLHRARQIDGPPLLLRFLLRLAVDRPGPEGDRLADLVKKIARERNLTEAELTATVRQPATTRPAEDHPLVLQITLDDVSPVGSDTEPVYAFEAVLFDTSEQPWKLLAKQAGNEPVSQSDLLRHGSHHLTSWTELASAAAHAEGLRVEFLLPWSLLGHPAELWPMDEDDYPVGMHFPVVVRSLDRIRSAFWHTAWKNKWRALEAAMEGSGPGTVADLPGWFVLTDGAAPIEAEVSARTLHIGSGKGDVRRWLDSRPHTAILALSFPYAYHPKKRAAPYQAVKDAVREGIPVMIWRRDTGSPTELHALLGELATAQLPALAAHVQRRRRAAREDDQSDLGRHLTLLWDEPGHAAWLAPAPFRAPAAIPARQEGSSV
ncbi:hypothetical protein [Kitasatospora sp. NPDC086791]|uniref:VMAP-C domain-containing protein n=1 Tax=Kitasatospora sp. NPDC086791 TaxID=3155178 RepID=UPI00342259B9